MIKKIPLIFLVSAATLSIIAIIIIQIYWIYTSWKNKEQAFSLAVRQSMESVVKKISEQEIADYIYRYEKVIDTLGKPSDSNFTDVFLFIDNDEESNLSTYYGYGILEETYQIAPTYIDPAFGEVTALKDFKNVRTKTILKNDVFNREQKQPVSVEKTKKISRVNLFERAKYRKAFLDFSNNMPLSKRLTAGEFSALFERALEEKNITTVHEFAIYDEGVLSDVYSKNFKEKQQGQEYSMPIFSALDEAEKPRYRLVVSFPQKKQYVLSRIFGIGILTVFLTLLIIAVFVVGLYQLIRQKKLSQMKSDFISNISHEFKTPISTINLALDAVSNPKNIGTSVKIRQYLGIIKEENTRMLTQVESILRISFLEKSSNSLLKEPIHLHEVVKKAVSHVALIIKNKKGHVTLNLKAANDHFLGNKDHFISVIVNILDNAVKYSEVSPIIELTTTNEDDYLVLAIRDEGIGMDAATQKKVFEKFYREQLGNIHNIRGHGLGLSYVKKIIDIHNGQITIDSKRGKGTTFIVKLSAL